MFCHGQCKYMSSHAWRGLDRTSLLATITAELRGDTCLHHMIIMVPNDEHDTTGDYVLLVDDRAPVPLEAQAQRIVDAAHTFTQVTTQQDDSLADAA